MQDDEFICTNCGDLLKDAQIAFYRAAISGGSTVSARIRCGRCGEVYPADQVAAQAPLPSTKKWWKLWK